MRVVCALLCFGMLFLVGILEASTSQENSHLKDTKLSESLGRNLDSSTQEFAFEMGKSPLEGINMLQYFGVILILVGLLVFLWYVKTRLNNPQIRLSKISTFGLLSDKKNLPSAVQIESIMALGFNSKLIVFEAYHKRYLVIVNPNGTKVVDSYSLDMKSNFTESNPKLESQQSQELFKELLEQELPSEAK